MTNPTPTDPTEAAKRIKELAEKRILDAATFIKQHGPNARMYTPVERPPDMPPQFAPCPTIEWCADILADAVLARPKARRLRWRPATEVGRHVGKREAYQVRVLHPSGIPDQHGTPHIRDFQLDEMGHWHIFEIACDPESGLPAPVELREVEG